MSKVLYTSDIHGDDLAVLVFNLGDIREVKRIII